MEAKRAKGIYLRNFIFGVEDSLVSTVGLLSGIAVGGVARNTIVLTGVVLIFVEAFSMAVGSFLSESSEEEYDGGVGEREEFRRSVFGAFIMFVSYFIAGFIPLFPYAVRAIADPFMLSIAASIGALFLLGVVSGRFTGGKVLWRAFRMAVLGGIAIAVGMLVGRALSS